MPEVRPRRRKPPTAAKAADAARQLRLDYRAAFATDAGQRVLADLLRRCHLAQTTWVPGQPDATAFREGQRRVGMEIVEMITADPEAVARLIRDGQTEGLFHG